MKNLSILLTFAAGLVFSPLSIATEHEKKSHQMVIKTNDGKQVRLLVHPEDKKHLDNAKKGDTVELFMPLDPSMSGPPIGAIVPGSY
jgi:hypothetical protein